MQKKLKWLADRTDPTRILADVGCDHGKVPLYLEPNRKAKIYATDISEASISKLRIVLGNRPTLIETRVTDGLKGLEGLGIEEVLIAGMGGHLIMEILEGSPEVLKEVQTLLLCPHNAQSFVRKGIRHLGFTIQEEAVLEEDGIFYQVMHAVRGPSPERTEREDRFGKENLEHPTEDFLEYVRSLRRKKRRLLDRLDPLVENQAKRRREVLEELEELEEILED